VDQQACSKIGKLIGVLARNGDPDNHILVADNQPLTVCVVVRIPEDRLEKAKTQTELIGNATCTTFMKPGAQQFMEFCLSSSAPDFAVVEIPEQLVDDVFWIQRQIRRSVKGLCWVSVCNTSSGHVSFPAKSGIHVNLHFIVLGESTSKSKVTGLKEQEAKMSSAGPNNSPVIQKNTVEEIAVTKKVESSCSLQKPASSQHSSLNTSGEESIIFNLNKLISIAKPWRCRNRLQMYGRYIVGIVLL
jgi:hypothetical protein